MENEIFKSTVNAGKFQHDKRNYENKIDLNLLYNSNNLLEEDKIKTKMTNNMLNLKTEEIKKENFIKQISIRKPSINNNSEIQNTFFRNFDSKIFVNNNNSNYYEALNFSNFKNKTLDNFEYLNEENTKINYEKADSVFSKIKNSKIINYNYERLVNKKIFVNLMIIQILFFIFSFLIFLKYKFLIVLVISTLCLFLNVLIVYLIKTFKWKKKSPFKLKILRHFYFFIFICLSYYIFFLVFKNDLNILKNFSWTISLKRDLSYSNNEYLNKENRSDFINYKLFNVETSEDTYARKCSLNKLLLFYNSDNTNNQNKNISLVLCGDKEVGNPIENRFLILLKDYSKLQNYDNKTIFKLLSSKMVDKIDYYLINKNHTLIDFNFFINKIRSIENNNNYSKYDGFMLNLDNQLVIDEYEFNGFSDIFSISSDNSWFSKNYLYINRLDIIKNYLTGDILLIIFILATNLPKLLIYIDCKIAICISILELIFHGFLFSSGSFLNNYYVLLMHLVVIFFTLIILKYKIEMVKNNLILFQINHTLNKNSFLDSRLLNEEKSVCDVEKKLKNEKEGIAFNSEGYFEGFLNFFGINLVIFKNGELIKNNFENETYYNSLNFMFNFRNNNFYDNKEKENINVLNINNNKNDFENNKNDNLINNQNINQNNNNNESAINLLHKKNTLDLNKDRRGSHTSNKTKNSIFSIKNTDYYKKIKESNDKKNELKKKKIIEQNNLLKIDQYENASNFANQKKISNLESKPQDKENSFYNFFDMFEIYEGKIGKFTKKEFDSNDDDSFSKNQENPEENSQNIKYNNLAKADNFNQKEHSQTKNNKYTLNNSLSDVIKINIQKVNSLKKPKLSKKANENLKKDLLEENKEDLDKIKKTKTCIEKKYSIIISDSRNNINREENYIVKRPFKNIEKHNKLDKDGHSKNKKIDFKREMIVNKNNTLYEKRNSAPNKEFIINSNRPPNRATQRQKNASETQDSDYEFLGTFCIKSLKELKNLFFKKDLLLHIEEHFVEELFNLNKNFKFEIFSTKFSHEMLYKNKLSNLFKENFDNEKVEKLDFYSVYLVKTNQEFKLPNKFFEDNLNVSNLLNCKNAKNNSYSINKTNFSNKYGFNNNYINNNAKKTSIFKFSCFEDSHPRKKNYFNSIDKFKENQIYKKIEPFLFNIKYLIKDINFMFSFLKILIPINRNKQKEFVQEDLEIESIKVSKKQIITKDKEIFKKSYIPSEPINKNLVNCRKLSNKFDNKNIINKRKNSEFYFDNVNLEKLSLLDKEILFFQKKSICDSIDEKFLKEVFAYKSFIFRSIKNIFKCNNNYNCYSQIRDFNEKINIKKIITFCYVVLNYYINSSKKIKGKVKPFLSIDTKIDTYEFYSSRYHIYQILLKFIKNAVKSIEKGLVILEAKINLENLLEINIIDQGKGMKKEKLNFIYNIFSDKESNKQGYFYYIKNLAKNLNFKIQIDSILNKGNVFGIILYPKLTKNKVNSQSKFKDFLKLDNKRNSNLIKKIDYHDYITYYLLQEDFSLKNERNNNKNIINNIFIKGNFERSVRNKTPREDSSKINMNKDMSDISSIIQDSSKNKDTNIFLGNSLQNITNLEFENEKSSKKTIIPSAFHKMEDIEKFNIKSKKGQRKLSEFIKDENLEHEQVISRSNSFSIEMRKRVNSEIIDDEFQNINNNKKNKIFNEDISENNQFKSLQNQFYCCQKKKIEINIPKEVEFSQKSNIEISKSLNKSQEENEKQMSHHFNDSSTIKYDNSVHFIYEDHFHLKNNKNSSNSLKKMETGKLLDESDFRFSFRRRCSFSEKNLKIIKANIKRKNHKDSDDSKCYNLNASESSKRIIISKINKKNLDAPFENYDSQKLIIEKNDSLQFIDFEDNLYSRSNGSQSSKIIRTEKELSNYLKTKIDENETNKIIKDLNFICKAIQDSPQIETYTLNKKELNEKNSENENENLFESEENSVTDSLDCNFSIDNKIRKDKLNHLFKSKISGRSNLSELFIPRRSSFYQEMKQKDKILIVEENKSNRDKIVDIFENFMKLNNKQFEILEANDGVDIINNIVYNNRNNSNNLKLVITTNNMQYINGINTIELIRDIEKTKNIFKNNFVLLLEESEYFNSNNINTFYLKGCDLIKNKNLENEDLKEIFNLFDI